MPRSSRTLPKERPENIPGSESCCILKRKLFTLAALSGLKGPDCTPPDELIGGIQSWVSVIIRSFGVGEREVFGVFHHGSLAIK